MLILSALFAASWAISNAMSDWKTRIVRGAEMIAPITTAIATRTSVVTTALMPAALMPRLVSTCSRPKISTPQPRATASAGHGCTCIASRAKKNIDTAATTAVIIMT